ncbi:MAG: four helix bundle protein [Bacteroidota bacterium]|nr:four helix bundle protein [Bacteroidota bacterium]MDP4228961.1 four helix bundle protein [Bacteroidota bacterium]MDP4236844.1 four helix bundle protein [Bacteroidota bacterium]
MAAITRFEDLIAWQKARILTRRIYECTRKDQYAKDFRLSGQIQSASVSIMANIAEGFERAKRTEFHQFLSIAKSSCAEVRSHLYVALDVNYINQTEFNDLMSLAVEVGKIIGGLRAKVEQQKNSASQSSALKSHS